MFLRCQRLRKNSQTRLYRSMIENRRIAGGGVLQRQALYLGLALSVSVLQAAFTKMRMVSVSAKAFRQRGA